MTNVPFITGYKEFCLALATRGAKVASAAEAPLGEQIGDVLSLPRVGSLGGTAQNHELWEQHLNTFLDFLLPMSMQGLYKV